MAMLIEAHMCLCIRFFSCLLVYSFYITPNSLLSAPLLPDTTFRLDAAS